MTWDNASEILDEQRALLEPLAMSLSGLRREGAGAANLFADVDRQTELGLNATIRMFSRTRKWPELTKAEATILVLRLEHGAALASLLAPSATTRTAWLQNPPHNTPDEDIIEWLLIDAWDEFGLGFLRDTIDSLLGGPPSTESADR